VSGQARGIGPGPAGGPRARRARPEEGRGTEARANEEYQRRGGPTTELWNLPEAGHAAALRTDPARYERRAIGFLDRALR
jgi:hypothetical protein